MLFGDEDAAVLEVAERLEESLGRLGVPSGEFFEFCLASVAEASPLSVRRVGITWYGCCRQQSRTTLNRHRWKGLSTIESLS